MQEDAAEAEFLNAIYFAFNQLEQSRCIHSVPLLSLTFHVPADLPTRRLPVQPSVTYSSASPMWISRSRQRTLRLAFPTAASFSVRTVELSHLGWHRRVAERKFRPENCPYCTGKLVFIPTNTREDSCIAVESNPAVAEFQQLEFLGK